MKRHLVEVGMTLYEWRVLKDVHWLKKSFLLLDNDLKKQKWNFLSLSWQPKEQMIFWGPFYPEVLIWFFVGWRQLIVCYTLLKEWNLEKIDSRITCETALKTNLSVQKTNLKRCFSSQKCTFIWIMVNMQ